jgi:hypothetical protein
LPKNQAAVLLHVKIQSKAEPRFLSELIAVRQVLNHFNSIGLVNYKYVEFGFDYGLLNEVPLRDVTILMPFVAAFNKSRGGKKVSTLVLPWHKDEVDLDNPGARVTKILEAYDVKLDLEFPIKDLTKKEVIGALPEELLELTHSCRYGYPPCGKCRPCKEIASIT